MIKPILWICVLFLILGFALGFSIDQIQVIEDQQCPQDWITDNVYGMQEVDSGVYRLVFDDVQADWSLTRATDSGSMEPLISGTTTVLYQSIDSIDVVAVGDIVIFDVDGLSIVHRIIEKDLDSQGDFLITKGDNNMKNDVKEFGKIREEQLRGVVIGIIY